MIGTEYDSDKMESFQDVWKPMPKHKTFGGGWFYLYREQHLFWFRFFDGYGVLGKSQKPRAFELFSERNGHRKYLKLFGWKFRILKPYRP